MTIDDQIKLIRRGAVDLISEEDLRKKLARDKPLNIKLGADPTAPESAPRAHRLIRSCAISVWVILSPFSSVISPA